MGIPAGIKRFAVCAVVALAACSDSNAPSAIANPAALIIDLFAADSAIDSDAFRALQDFAGLVPIPAPPVMARAVTALRATLPAAPGSAARALRGGGVDRPRRASLLPPVLPDTLLGVTFEWEPDSVGYVATARTGAPPNGVRFILYLADAITTLPDTGQEVGSLDILDLAPAAGAELRFLLLGVTGSPTFLDYTLDYVEGTNAATVGANGFVSNGAAGVRERRFTFDAGLTFTGTPGGSDQTMDFAYDVNVPDVGVNLHLGTSEDTLADSTLTEIDYRLTRRNENLRFQGADTVSSNGAVEHGQFVVSVNNQLYATLNVTEVETVITDRNGNVVPVNDNDDRYEDTIILLMLFGVLYSTALLAEVLAIPAILLGFTIGGL